MRRRQTDRAYNEVGDAFDYFSVRMAATAFFGLCQDAPDMLAGLARTTGTGCAAGDYLHGVLIVPAAATGVGVVSPLLSITNPRRKVTRSGVRPIPETQHQTGIVQTSPAS